MFIYVFMLTWSMLVLTILEAATFFILIETAEVALFCGALAEQTSISSQTSWTALTK